MIELPESVEGIDAAHVVYRLKARVVRGKFSHDIVAKKVCLRTLSWKRWAADGLDSI